MDDSPDTGHLKAVQQQLLSSERRLRYVLEATGEGIWDWDVAGGSVTHNQRWCQIVGMNDSYLQHPLEDFSSLLHPQDRGAVFERLQVCLQGRGRYHSEHRIQRPDGRTVWVLDRGDVVERGADGGPLRMVGSCADITERKQAERALSLRTELLDAIFELSPDGFLAFDSEHCVSFVSRAFCEMTGLPETHWLHQREAQVSQTLTGLGTAVSRFEGIARLRERQGSAPTQERVLIELAAGSHVLEVGLRLGRDPTVPQILYLRDVTHETEVDQMKSNFLATAAHELRTPMASIYGFAELLLGDDVDTASRQEFMGIIYRQSELMVAILNELLDLARIEARRGKDFVIESLSLQDLVHAVVSGFKPAHGRSAPVLDLPAAPLRVLADRKKLQQALLNVLSNAYKYSPAGGPVGIALTCAAATPTGPSEYVLTIIDAGMGMTAPQVARVFERFYRANSSGSVPGTGLGMCIVKEIIDLHHGRIDIQSEPGRGTRVVIALPAQPTWQPVSPKH